MRQSKVDSAIMEPLGQVVVIRKLSDGEIGDLLEVMILDCRILVEGIAGRITFFVMLLVL